MARFQITQTRQGGEAVVLAAGIRRCNGALAIQAEHVAMSRAHLQGKAIEGDRVVEGPVSQEEGAPVQVVLFGPDVDYTIEVRIERV